MKKRENSLKTAKKRCKKAKKSKSQQAEEFQNEQNNQRKRRVFEKRTTINFKIEPHHISSEKLKTAEEIEQEKERLVGS